jgi:hypothetical protein
MAQPIDNQTFLPFPKEKRANGQHASFQSDAPKIISKKWLCNHFGILPNSYRTHRLRTLVATPEVLAHLQITIEEWNRIQEFDALQSLRLREILQL